MCSRLEQNPSRSALRPLQERLAFQRTAPQSEDLEIQFGSTELRVPPRVSIILPTYNERDNIEPMILSILRQDLNVAEVIVVDDNSPDGTSTFVKTISLSIPRVRVISRRYKRGLASAVAEGVSAASGDIIAWMDCDFSHPVELLSTLLETLDEADIALASRYVRGGGSNGPLGRKIASLGACLVSRVLLGRSVKDYTSGYVAVKKAVLEKVPIVNAGLLDGRLGYGDYFFAFLYLAKKAGYHTHEVPYVYKDRVRGSSKVINSFFDFFLHGTSYLTSMTRLRLGRFESLTPIGLCSTK